MSSRQHQVKSKERHVRSKTYLSETYNHTRLEARFSIVLSEIGDRYSF